MVDLKKTFDVLRTYKMKLNPVKYTFKVSSKKFLGFIVNHLGIKANLTKIKALIEMRSTERKKKSRKYKG